MLNVSLTRWHEYLDEGSFKAIRRDVHIDIAPVPFPDVVHDAYQFLGLMSTDEEADLMLLVPRLENTGL